MKLNEFKAWFEGYTESIEGAPTKKQWARIKERVEEIDGTPVTERIFVDQHWRYSYPWWHHQYPGTVVMGASTGAAASETLSYNASSPAVGEFDGCAAMYAVGRAEALSQN